VEICVYIKKVDLVWVGLGCRSSDKGEKGGCRARDEEDRCANGEMGIEDENLGLTGDLGRWVGGNSWDGWEDQEEEEEEKPVKLSFPPTIFFQSLNLSTLHQQAPNPPSLR